MPDFTEFLNLYLPGGGSTGTITPDEVVDIDRLNENFRQIDDFAESWGLSTSKRQGYYGPAAARNTITGMKRGDTYQESDGDFDMYVYDGAAWKNRTPGKMCGLTSSTSLTNGTTSPSWTTATTAHAIDTGSFLDTEEPTRVHLKRVGWYDVTYAIKSNAVAPITAMPRLNGTTLPYASAGAVGTGGAATTAARGFRVKATATTDYLDFQMTSNAGASGSHSVFVEYKGDF